MYDPIEIELASGLNRVLYKKNNDILTDIVVDPGTKLFIMIPIGTLAEVQTKSITKTNEVWSAGPAGKKIATVDLFTGTIDTTIFAEPPGSVGGKRKTRKYKMSKRKTRKIK